MISCVLRASLSGYFSNTIDLSGRRAIDDPNLPLLVLRSRATETTFGGEAGVGVPRSANRAWGRAGKAVQGKDWAEAERQLRIALEAAPGFSHAWHMLGVVCQNRAKQPEARAAYRRAIEAGPNAPGPYVLLAPLDIEAKDWPAAIRTADSLLKLDKKRRYPEAYMYKAIAQYHLGEVDAAEASARQATLLDTRHRLPRAEYILGVILARRRDYTGAAAHMRRYLELEPKAADAEAVRAHIAGLGTPEVESSELALPSAAERMLPAAGEAWVPGGIAAMSRAAHLSQTVPAGDFFLEYCRAVARRGGLPEDLRQYFAAVSELEQTGEKRDDKTVIVLSLSAEAKRRDTERILPLIGWRLAGNEEAAGLEPGDRPSDGPRQRLMAALGSDEMVMAEALEAGRAFTFEIPSETARLIGGDAWSGLLYANELLPGGLAEAFALDPRLAKTYAALSTMGADTASALVSAVELRVLVERHADVLFRCAGAFAIRKGAAVVPGGGKAEEVWADLAGVSPRDPAAFFRALLEKDMGKLAVFHLTLSGADARHQQFFTASAALSRRFYQWYSNSAELQGEGAGKPRNTWCAALFRDLPLDNAGRVVFPGGRRAWTDAADDALLTMPWLEALPEVARMERDRKTPFDERSAALLARGFAECRRVYPLFGEMSGLGRDDFDAFF
jgi:tetratricopeptide (TPR) repeat protein